MQSFAVVTFGCQMNQHDSERIREHLVRAGYCPAPGVGTADVVVVNTCSVRAKAEQKLRSALGRLGRAKRARPGMLLCVAGCVAQQEGARLASSFPELDLVIGPDNIAELPALLAQVSGGAAPVVRTAFDLDEPRFLAADPAAGTAPVSAHVTVMKGCNERCSFCIVPRVRGPERYRPAAEIVNEIVRLCATGTREVTLLGQTVNSYRDPLGELTRGMGAGPSRLRAEASEFGALLLAIAARAPALRRLRYTSPHPRFINETLITAHRELPLLAAHVHLPVQSGSDRILKRMLRRHTVAEFDRWASRLREAVAGLTLSTDVIVGFPGERREDFEATLRLVQRQGFTGLFGFKYSPRPGTSALRFGDDVDEPEKAARLAEVFAVADATREAHLGAMVGASVQVLVEGRGREGRWTGRTGRNEIVHFSAPGELAGRVVEVRIIEACRHSLLAEPVGLPPPRADSTARLSSSTAAGCRRLQVV